MILLDLIMPRMDGFEVLSALRNDPKLSQIPIIVLTTAHNAEARCLRLGAVDFITKPYETPEVILARVTNLVMLIEGKSIIRATETDALTGLYTSEYFFQHIRRLDIYYPDKPMDVIALNVNRFHLINELNGRTFGDSILTSISERVKTLTAQNGGLACRSSADLFYLYIPHNDNYESMLGLLTDDISEYAENSGISLRMGVFPLSDKNTDPETRFARANYACNSIRGKYSSCFRLYDEKMHAKELYYEKLINDMETGIREYQFKVYYQPKYNITDTDLCFPKALFRSLRKMVS